MIRRLVEFLPDKFLPSRRGRPGWTGKQVDGRPWVDVPHPDTAASKRQRRARLVIALMLLALPFSLFACAQGCSARTAALSAVSAANNALERVAAREAVEQPQLTLPAVAAVQRRLYAGGHWLSDAELIPDGFQLVDTGEDHRVGIVYGGALLMTARAVVHTDGLVGVTFGSSDRAEVADPAAAGPPRCQTPDASLVADLEGAPWIALYDPATSSEVTLDDVWPDARASTTLVEHDKLEQWLAAWVRGDQDTLRELGNHTAADLRPWWHTDGWTYAAGSARTVSVVELFAGGEPLLVAHVQFAMCDTDTGGLIFQDLEVEMRQDGELLRILDATTMGEPL